MLQSIQRISLKSLEVSAADKGLKYLYFYCSKKIRFDISNQIGTYFSEAAKTIKFEWFSSIKAVADAF